MTIGSKGGAIWIIGLVFNNANDVIGWGGRGVRASFIKSDVFYGDSEVVFSKAEVIQSKDGGEILRDAIEDSR